MAGYGKNSRGGKRGSSSLSSSSSSYFSTTTMLLVLACCVFAVYMLTSSSITPPHATPASSNLGQHHHHHHKRNAIPTPPRSFLRDPQPADDVREDTQGDLPVEAVRGHHESISSKNQEEVTNDSAGTEEDSRSEVEAVHHEKQQQEDVETNPGKPLQEEEVETRRNDEEVPHDQPDVVNEQQQQEQQPVGDDRAQEQPQQQQDQNQEEEQQQNGAVNGQSNEEQQQQQQQQQQHIENEEQQQQQQQSSEQNSEEHEQQQHEQHDEEQSNDESQQQQQHSETIGDEGHPDETGNNESQQQSVAEIDDNQSKNLPQIIEQVTDGSNSQSGGGEGISSQSQIEHDTDGTTEHQQQQQEEEQQQRQQEEEEQQQQQQQEEEKQQEQQQEQQPQDSTQPQQTEDESSTGGGKENKLQPNEDSLNVNDSLPEGGQSDVEIENKGDKKTWATQADQSSNEKERRKGEESSQSNKGGGGDEEEGNAADAGKPAGLDWELCNVTAGPDYIPCLDNEKAIKQLRSFRHFEHRERHCPEEGPTCLVPLPKGYRPSIPWPQSRDRIWYNNVPRTKLAEVKGHQNWVKVTGEYLTFPGGGTQFIHGALHYIDFIQQSVPEIAWGKHTRVILDVGCGVASFGGYLFERDVLAMSFAPKDEHEAQVQFALERGIPAISAVMGSQRLPFPSRVFDIVHCARCRVPWHANDGALLLELNRVLRPGGFFVWSATPVYQKLKEDVEIWEAMSALTKSMCWELLTIKRDKLNSVGAAIYRKPITNDCYENRNEQKPPMCKEGDDPNAAWYVPLQSCMHPVPVDPPVRGSKWPLEWPRRVQVPPYWLNSSQIGVYGRPAPDDFTKDYEHWKRVVNKSYLNGFGIDWSRVRNVMDMRAIYGGFAAALKDMKVWVMNLVDIDSPDTLPIIYERGLFGMYHDWCESFSTYPRTYDLLHADHLFSQVRKRCKVLAVVAEVDRITRPGGKLIVRDESDAVGEVENLLKSLHWEIRLTYSRSNEGILCAEKTDWRPEKIASSA